MTDTPRPFGFLLVYAYIDKAVPKVVINPADVRIVLQVEDGRGGHMPHVELTNGDKFDLFGISFQDFVVMLDVVMRERGSVSREDLAALQGLVRGLTMRVDKLRY